MGCVRTYVRTFQTYYIIYIINEKSDGNELKKVRRNSWIGRVHACTATYYSFVKRLLKTKRFKIGGKKIIRVSGTFVVIFI